MKFAIFGSGAVGGYYGARLAQAGHEVGFVARGEHLAAIRERGLRVESVLGDVTIQPARATSRPEELAPVDWVICAVKAWQVPEAGRALAPLVGPDTGVLPLQNGVEAADQLAAAVGAAAVVGGTTWILSTLAGPGLIRHSGAQPRIALGELDGRRTPRVEALAAALTAAGVSTDVSSNVLGDIWQKFAFIAPVSGVGAVTRLPMGAWREIPETRALLRAAIEETVAVARAGGVELSPDAVDSTLAFVDRLPPHSTASMQRDISEGRPSELAAQSGTVVRLGAERGVPTPTHAALLAALLPAEQRARSEAGLT